MGIFSRMKRAAKAKANSAIDKRVDPEKELDLAIQQLEQQRQEALKELLSYKTSAKQMEQDIERHAKKAAEWERRAVEAVKAGDDELARQALREKKLVEEEGARVQRDRDEAAGYAIELNRSRKQFETKLRILKLKKGTMAAQIAAARRGGGDTFGTGELWDRFASAEDKIDAESIEAEVQSSLESEDLLEADFDAKLLRAGAQPTSGGDDALAALKQKMAADKERRLGAGREQRALGEGERGAADKE